MKKCGNWRYEAYYLDYAMGLPFWALVFALTLGMIETPISLHSIIDVLQGSDIQAYGWALFSGMMWNIGNVLLIAAIVLAG
jgi:glucose uptake protein